MLYLGLARQTDRSISPSVESEDTRIAQRMKEAGGRAVVSRIAQNTAQQVEDYLNNHFSVIGIVGINGSPSCGVETTWSNDSETGGYGVLISELSNQLKKVDTRIPIRGIKSRDVVEAVKTIRELIDADA